MGSLSLNQSNSYYKQKKYSNSKGSRLNEVQNSFEFKIAYKH